jgi:hypothetical protein
LDFSFTWRPFFGLEEYSGNEFEAFGELRVMKEILDESEIMTNKISEDFCNIRGTPVICETVIDAIKALQRLPSDLPIHQGFGHGVRMIVYNATTDEDTHLSFENSGVEFIAGD